MADSLFSSLRNMLDQHTVSQMAGALGQPEQSVSRGIDSSLAALLSGLFSKSNDPAALRSMLDIAPSREISGEQIASGISDPNSPLMATGKRLLASLFGSEEGTVVNGLSRESGMGTGVISTLMATLAPMAMSFIGRKVRDGGLSMTEIGNMLRHESGTIRNMLPAGLRDMFWATEETTRVSPVVAQAVTRERRSNWLPVIALAALGLGLIWLLSHGHRKPVSEVTPVPSGQASRTAPAPQNPANVNIPEGTTESRLLAFVQDPNTKAQDSPWFILDQVNFDTASATLRPSSQAELDHLAAILTNHRNVRLEVAGFTDNVGSAGSNMQLSRDRANTVRTELINKGVSADSLTTGAYGAQHPVATNETPEGRAQNRRVAVRVVQK